MLTVNSSFDEPLVTVPAPLDVHLAPVDSNTSVDLLALGSGGDLTVALNRGNDTWESSQTVDLGLGPLNGLGTGLLNADLFPDLIVQGPDSLSIATGDGNGGFTVGQTIAASTPGSFAPTAGGRVRMDVSPLNSDLMSDVVTVAPGTDKVLVFLGNDDGTLAAPIIYSSGGDQPLVAIAGDFIGDRAPDIAVGHADGSLTFLEGTGDGTFTLRGDLTITGLGTITDLEADDYDGDGDTDLVVTGGTQAQLLLQDADPLASPPIQNGSFSQGLTDWTAEIAGHQAGATPGVINAQNGFAQFVENDSFLVTLKQSFVVPDDPQTVEFDLRSLGLEDAAGGIPDAFEASLLDANQQSLVPTHRPAATSFFNTNPDNAVSLATGVTFDGTKASLDISSVAPGTAATLVFDLVGSPGGNGSVASIDNVQVTPTTVLSETFTAVPLSGPFTDARSVSRGDVDGEGSVDLVFSDGGTDQLLVFNGDGTGTFTRSEIDLSSFGAGAAGVATGRLTAGDTADDIAVLLASSNLVVTPLLADFDAPSPMFTSPAPGEVVTDALSEFTVQFSEPVQDNGPTGDNSVTNPDAYSLTAAGADGVFGTGDDISVPISAVSYNSVTNEATISVGPSALPLVDAAYQLTVNGSDPAIQLLDAAGNTLMGGVDAVLNFSLNTPSQITSLTSLAGNEGESLALAATFADPGFQDSRTATIDWGDGTASDGVVDEGLGTITADHTYADDGNFTVTLSLTDAAGNEVTQTTTATITNVAPQATAAPDQSATVGEAFTAELATFTDVGFDNSAGGTQEAFFATIDWGDGMPAEVGTVTVTPGSEGVPTMGTVSGVHVYLSTGPFTVTVTLDDGDGGTDSATLVVTVAPSSTGTNRWLPTIDFETDAAGNPLAAGDLIAEQWAAWGVHVTTNDPAAHPAMIFDSANPTGDDTDLTTTNRRNVLIISEDGDSSDPGDNDSGGTLIFTFDQPVMLDDVDLLDIDEDGTAVVLFDEAGVEIANVAAVNLGDNSQQTVTLNSDGVSRMEIRLAGSAAVANVVFCRDIQPGDYASLSGADSSDEGAEYALDLSSTASIAEWTINWGDETAPELIAGTLSTASHFFTDGADHVAIVATAADNAGNVYLTNTLEVDVNNVAPLLTISGAATVEAGATYTLDLASDDPGTDTIHRWEIDWGDGSPLEHVAGNPSSVDYIYGFGPQTHSIQAFAYDEDSTVATPSVLEIIARGDEGGEQFNLLVDEQIVATYTVTTAFLTFTYQAAEHLVANQIRIEFINDQYDAGNGIDANLTVDAIKIDGRVYETEASDVYSTGTWLPADGIQPGFRESETLHANGYLQYDAVPGAQITIVARGDEGGEQFNLLIQGEVVASYTVGTGDQTFVYSSTEEVTPDQIRIEFTNDFYDPGNGIDKNLIVDYVAIDGQVYQMEANDVYSTGTWLPADGIQPGFRQSDTLHTNGYFQYAAKSLTPYVSNTISVEVTPSTNQSLPTIDFEAAASGAPLQSGDLIGEQWAAWGVHVTSNDPVSHPPMIFDTAHPTGEDTDLATANQQHVLILSEDADSTDPDDNAAGGTIIFTFDTPVMLDEIGLLDVDEYGTTIVLFDETGAQISSTAEPNMGDGSQQSVALDATGVGRMEIRLAGSAAVTEFVFSRDADAQPVTPPATKFFVVDGQLDRTFRYDGQGVGAGSFDVTSSGVLRGAASAGDGNPLWTVDSNEYVSVFDTDDNSLLGSWYATDVDWARGIAADGTDLWIVDASNARLYHYADGAALRTGSHSASSCFSLAVGNTDPSGVTTDGTRLWVTDRSADKVFVYDTAGTSLGSWSLDAANGHASGIAITLGGSDLYVTDFDDVVIYRYADAANVTSGSLAATGTIALADANTRPEGISDPVFTYNIGDLGSGDITTTTQVDDYVFDATAGQSIFFDALSGDRFALQIDLINPSGSNVWHINFFQDVDTVQLTETGQYSFRVRSIFGGLSDYSFEIVDVPAPSIRAISLGEIVNDDISVRGSEDHFTFSATASQRTFIDTQGNSGGLFDLQWRLLDPNGTQIANFNRWGDGGPVDLPLGGTYTFVVDGSGDATDSYQFQLTDVTPQPATPINLNDVINADIAIAGE